MPVNLEERIDRLERPASVGRTVIGKSMADKDGAKDATQTESERFLARAYSLKTAGQARSLYRDWAPSYDQHLEQELRYIGPASIAALLAFAASTSLSDWVRRRPSRN